jgi:hypothetical protein
MLKGSWSIMIPSDFKSLREPDVTSERERILDFVRGRRDVESLTPLGITVTTEGDSVAVENPRRYVVTATANDVAEGLLRLASREEELRRWAGLLLAASPFVELALDDVPYGDVLLEGLWDASAGEPVRVAALLAAKELSVR